MKLLEQEALARSFYQRETSIVAQALLGTMLIRVWQDKVLAGIISETEAYGGSDDPASHAYGKQTDRNKAMFGTVGCSYIYFIYGNHYCFNVVARSADSQAGAVLIRAIVPVIGKDHMQALRGYTIPASHLTNGPGKMCQALQLTLADNVHDVTQKSSLYITRGIELDADAIGHTARIGISKACDRTWRFVLKSHIIASYTNIL